MKAKYTGASQEQINFGSCDDPRPLLEVGKEYDVLGLEIHSFHTKIILTDFHNLRFNSASFDIDGATMKKALLGWEDNKRQIENNYPYIYYPEA